jgi:hypothetical protein
VVGVGKHERPATGQPTKEGLAKILSRRADKAAGRPEYVGKHRATAPSNGKTGKK